MLRVSEIFGPTIQGEGQVIGLPTVFVRLGGCDYRCSWCDSLHAVLPEHKAEWTPQGEAQIADTVDRLAGSPILVTLSGGNPALYDCGPLIRELHARGHTVALETQGSKAKPWFHELDYLTLSPKPPSSGMHTTHIEVARCMAAAAPSTRIGVKVVIFDDADLTYFAALRDAFREVRRPIDWSVQVGNTDVAVTSENRRDDMLDALTALAEKVIARGWYDVRVLPQLHALMWGNARAR